MARKVIWSEDAIGDLGWIDSVVRGGHFAVMHTLTAVIFRVPKGRWFVAQNPETGTTTQGRTMDKALANLREATELYLSEFPLPKKGHAVLTTFEVEASNA